MEDTKKLIAEELNKMKGLMSFKVGMTKTELKTKLMNQLAEEAADVKEDEVAECDDVKEDDVKEEDVAEDVKEEEVTEEPEVKEDMFEKPEIKPGGYKMTQGFVNESALSNKERKLKNKKDRLDKKLGRV